MKKLKLIIFGIFFLLNISDAQQVAPTPPMGWNSFNSFGSAVEEADVLANANYVAANLKKYGWQYIVIDYCWSYDYVPGSVIADAHQYRRKDGSYVPWLEMDNNGRLLPDVNKFPSSYAGKGFKAIADSIHAMGLKFGIHVMRGIPRQAIWAKSQVLGVENITADMIADTLSVCNWLNQMNGLNMSKNGAQQYLNSLLKLYASWEVDFIKVDDISLPYHAEEIEGYKKAIENCGRPIVLSLSPGATPVEKASHVKKYANMWRMADDFWDNWVEILKMFNYAKAWEGKGEAGNWPDCDMMQIGKLSKRGPNGVERFSRFTEDELYTHFTFWSIFKSPLIIGSNLPENRLLETTLITNEEVIAVNQQGQNPRQLYKNDSSMIWVSQVPDSKDIYVALFNIADAAHDVTLSFTDLKINNCTVRDLWKKQDLGKMKKQLVRKINAHGAMIFKVYVK